MLYNANPNYILEIKRHGETTGVAAGENVSQSPDENTVYAYIPQQTGIQIQSDWEPVIANAIQNAIGGSVGTGLGIAGALGYRVNDKLMTAQIWKSTEPADMTFTLQFDAIKSVKRDVIDPVKKLLKWSVPGRTAGGFVMESPGPTLQTMVTNPDKNRTSLRIGRMLYFDNVIIPSLSITWVTAPDNSGQMIGADVEITFRTFFSPDIEDVMRYFTAGETGDESYNSLAEQGNRIRNIIPGGGTP